MAAAPGVSVRGVLRGRAVFLTGATGFLGKCVLERLLRVYGDELARVWVLVRPRGNASAADRLRDEVLASPCFERCRGAAGGAAAFERLAARLVRPVAGDLLREGLGLGDGDAAAVRDAPGGVVFFHCAATVDFSERLDRAVEMNLGGSLRVLRLAASCGDALAAFVHVSTAYVNSNRRGGWVHERLYPLGFDLDAVLARVRSASVASLEGVDAGGLLGRWPNTYTLSKAMAEHALSREARAAGVPLAVVRPTIIGSAVSEPVPGWIDTLSAAGAVFLAGGLGAAKFLPGSDETVGDLVPVDAVVGAMLLAAAAAVDDKDKDKDKDKQPLVFHASSSAENPVTWGVVRRVVVDHYRDYRPQRAVGPAKFFFVGSPLLYQLAFFLHYTAPAAAVSTAALALGPAARARASQVSRMVWRVRMLAESFRHFVARSWTFDNQATRALEARLAPAERAEVSAAVAGVDWPDYLRCFQYGLARFVLREDVVPLPLDHRPRRVDVQDAPVQPASLRRDPVRRLFPDAEWVLSRLGDRPPYPAAPSPGELRRRALASPLVAAAVREAGGEGEAAAAVRAEAEREARRIGGVPRAPVVAALGYTFRKAWRRLFRGVSAGREGLEAARRAALRGPVVFVPTHRSYVDFLVVSYACLACGLPMPHIAAGDDFLDVAGVRSVFRGAGAFFLRRSFRGNRLRAAVFAAHVEELLRAGQSLEFFVEGTRSRSGKTMRPRFGMLRVLVEAQLAGRLPPCVTLVPLAVNYEVVVEGDSLSRELLGQSKIRESLDGLVRSCGVLRRDHGRVSLQFGEPVELGAFVAAAAAAAKDGAAGVARALGGRVARELERSTECMPTHLVAALLLCYRGGVPRAQLVELVSWLRLEVLARGGRVSGVEMLERRAVVDGALRRLGQAVSEPREGVFAPAPTPAGGRNHCRLLELGMYRNQLLHLFYVDALWAAAVYARGAAGRAAAGEAAALLERLLRREVLLSERPDSGPPPGFAGALDGLVRRGVLREDAATGALEVEASGERLFTFLCSLAWPLVDGYFAVAAMCRALQPDRRLRADAMLQRAQALAVSMYDERQLSFYESCSRDTLRGALDRLGDLGVVERAANDPDVVLLSDAYQVEPGPLSVLIDSLDGLRKPSPARGPAFGSGDHLRAVANLPQLAKL